MPTPSTRRSTRGTVRSRACALSGLVFLSGLTLLAQSPANTPASIPAGADSAAPAAPKPEAAAPQPAISSKQAREAEDAFIQGAKDVDRKDLDAAEKSFQRALQLNPTKRDYALALAVVREHRLTELVQQAARARQLGDNTRADALLDQARTIDPDNTVVAQHFGTTPTAPPAPIQPVRDPGPLGGAIELTPRPGQQDLHFSGTEQDLLRSVYNAFGISVTFDAGFTASKTAKLNLDNVSFADAARVVTQLTHTFAVPAQPRSVLIAEDTQENRDRLQPQLEETVYMPGLTADQMSEMATLARQVFLLRSVTASSATDTIVLRGDEQSLNVLNATYNNMLGGGSDVLLDVNLYEIDRNNTRNIGFELPTSIGIFSVAAEAAQLVAANQSIISQAIAAGLIKITGNPITDLITEVGFLIASGAVTSSQYTNLLGTIGGGLTLTGVFVNSGSTLNLLLNASDVRILDAIKLRSGDRQDATFRAGERYPITTSTYTSGVASSVASAVAGLNINGTSVNSLLQQYLGSSTVTIPQIQFEDLGLTLKATPQIQHDRSVSLKLDLKIESLGATSLNGIPVLNNRELTSTVTVPAGETALLASEVSSSEMKDVQGLPGLSEIPGFQDTTNTNTEKDTSELLITITPHIVRENLRIASRALAVPHASPSEASYTEPEPPPPPPNAPSSAPEAPGAAGAPQGPPNRPLGVPPESQPTTTPATPPESQPSTPPANPPQ
jgi:general secretion pathway protein D